MTENERVTLINRLVRSTVRSSDVNMLAAMGVGPEEFVMALNTLLTAIENAGFAIVRSQPVDGTAKH